MTKARKGVEWHKEAIMLRLKGVSYTDIADIVKVSRQRVQQVLSPPPGVRNMVVKNADGCCESCGILVGRSGHVHHVGAAADTPDTYNDIDMLQLLCGHCHMSLHHPPKVKTAKIKPKNPDVVALGRLGGKVGGKPPS